MLGERIPAAAGARVGPRQPRRARRRLRRPRSTALRDRLAAGPTRSYAGTKRQLNHWLYARMEEQLELEADIQQEMAGSHDFAEGVAAFVAEAPGRRSEGGESRHLRAVVRRAVNRIRAPWPGPPATSRSPSPRLRRCLVAARWRCWPSPAPPSPTALTPESGGSPNADEIDSLYKIVFAVAHRRLRRRRGRAALLAVQVPRAQGRASPPRSAATRAWRSAGPSAPR